MKGCIGFGDFLKFNYLFIFLILVFSSCSKPKPLRNSVNLKSKAGLIYARGDSLYNLSDWRGAIKCYLQAAPKFLDASKKADVFNDIGLSYKRLGIYDSASKFYDLSLEINRNLNDSIKVIFGLRNIGNVLRNQGRHREALDYYLESLSISTALGRERASAQSYVSIGNIYLDLRNNMLALSEYRRARKVYSALGDSLRLARVLNNIGDTHKQLENYDSALTYYQYSLVLKKKHADKASLAFTIYNRGSVFLNLKEFDSAEYYLKWALRIREEVQDQKELAVTSNELAKLYLRKELPGIALPYLNKALEYAKEQDNKTVFMESLSLRSDYFLQTDDPVKAYAYLKGWSTMKDSVFNKEQVEVLKRQNEYVVKKKEAERLLEEERADSEYETAQNRLKVIIMTIGLVVLLMVTLLIFLVQQKKINSLNSSLRLLNRDMFHRKRNDYSRILKSIDRAGFPETDAIRNMIFASNAVDDTLYADLDDQKAINLSYYFAELLEDLSDSLELDKKGILLTTEILSTSLSGEKAVKVAFIICELITNSVKHSFITRQGKIHLSIQSVDDILRVKYQDDGAAIPLEHGVPGKGMGQNLIRGFLESLNTSLQRERLDNINVLHFDISG